MLFNDDKISIRQMQIMFVLDLFGTVVLTLPRITAETAGVDAWIAVLLAMGLAFVYAYIISSLAVSFPNDTFVGYSEKILGKVIGCIVSVIFFSYILLVLGMEVRIFGEINKVFILPSTPIEFMIMTMLFLAAYLVRKGYEAKARFSEFIFLFVFVPLLIELMFILPAGDFSNLLPVFHTPVPVILKTSVTTSLTYIILPLILLYVPYYNKPKKTRSALLKAVAVAGILQSIVVIVTIVKFGVNDTEKMIWPIISIMQSVSLPQSFLERQEGLVMIFWTLSIFSVINAFLHAASFILSRIFKTKEHNLFVLPLIPIIYFLALQPQNIAQVYEYSTSIRGQFGIGFLILLPILLLVVAKLRGVKGGSNEKTVN